MDDTRSGREEESKRPRRAPTGSAGRLRRRPRRRPHGGRSFVWLEAASHRKGKLGLSLLDIPARGSFRIRRSEFGNVFTVRVRVGRRIREGLNQRGGRLAKARNRTLCSLFVFALFRFTTSSHHRTPHPLLNSRPRREPSRGPRENPLADKGFLNLPIRGALSTPSERAARRPDPPPFQPPKPPRLSDSQTLESGC